MENKPPNNFVRAMIVGLVLALCAVSFFNFFHRDPPFEISAGFLALVALVVLLALSEVFDSLSFGSILSLRRKVEEEKEIKNELKKENQELRSQLFSFVSQQQSQVNNTFNVPLESLRGMLGVIPANPTQVAEDLEAQIPPSIAKPEEPDDRMRLKQRQARRRIAESLAINKYFSSIKVPLSEQILNAEFSSAFHDIDPVMDRSIIFDAYAKTESSERFVEAVSVRQNSVLFWDRLYVMLNKIWLYRQAKKVNAELILILMDHDDDPFEDKPVRSYSWIEKFQPAIANGILRVERIKISAAEIDSLSESDQSKLF